MIPSEAETFWVELLRDLTRRGLKGVELVISDAHQGLQTAVARVLGAAWHNPTESPFWQAAWPRPSAK